ncbi:uncharacterized protein ColSpa_11066 [Colletotrichum spaethianum]|uniref:Uncharacterized protein n=1 Tax=Colletotrichum spaethianum TaxID=700344 RepID=A0AA37PEM2_9PEZI|nr:uncharacterized protein ColSpa_11066 [Colletotrichum spaethianum]GKT50885.1 hypothetical protein ColSpa_11066 [Colletotrichum spaethianum]
MARRCEVSQMPFVGTEDDGAVASQTSRTSLLFLTLAMVCDDPRRVITIEMEQSAHHVMQELLWGSCGSKRGPHCAQKPKQH